jgi:hypothetical protein
MESPHTTTACPWKAMSTDSDMQHATEQKRNQKIEEEARKSMAQIVFSKLKRCFVNRAWNGSLSRVETVASFFTPSGNVDQSVPEVSARDLGDDWRAEKILRTHCTPLSMVFCGFGFSANPRALSLYYVPMVFFNYNLKNTFIYLRISAWINYNKKRCIHTWC